MTYAQEQAASQQAAVRFFAWDALAEDFPHRYDVVICSLFLHHLGEDQAVLFLRRMALPQYAWHWSTTCAAV